ncbi:MAG TPA: tRNA pseudouridine(13) synthase TruD [Candidatus Nanoarchaeia archaeon]|nr:tRNA pseudouridine(13) synthase TruD [Candidatus Nanoarchaeia archaeon]
MAYVIKHLPEDFVVHELPSLQVTDKGTYTCFLLTKRNITTTDAVDMIASDLRIPSRRIGYAGLKDKHGITSQVCTIEGEFSQALRQTKISDLTIELLGHADRPASLGILAGNHFTITVRNIETAPDLSSPAFYNYFGPQRFSGHNINIGRLLLQRRFKDAVDIINAHSPAHGRLLSDERAAHGPINALSRLPPRIISLYINSYQSWLFNEALRELVGSGSAVPEKLPLVGFGTEDEAIPPLMKSLLTKDGLSTRSFVFREMPSLSSEGSMRRTVSAAQELVAGPLEDDECHAGKKKISISFSLTSGCYATTFISQKFP